MFQESELIDLGVSLIVLVIVLLTIRKHELPGFVLFYVGFGCIFAAAVFTVLEGVLWHELFDALEHISYGLAGISFGTGCILHTGKKPNKRQGQETG